MLLDPFEEYFSDEVVVSFRSYIRAAFPRNRALMFSGIPRSLNWKMFAGEIHLFRRSSPMVLYAIGRLIDLERIELHTGRAGVRADVSFLRTADHNGMTNLMAAAIPPPEKYPPTLVATTPLPPDDVGLNLFWDARTDFPSVPFDIDSFRGGDFVLIECRVVRRIENHSTITYEFRLGSLTLIAPR